MGDEDTFVLPGAWRRSRVPRRGSVGIAPLTPAPGAAAQVAHLVADRDDAIREFLGDPQANPALREAATAYLDGRPSPVGAGAIAFLAGFGGRRDREDAAAFADAWLVEHGPVFAAEAAVVVLSVGLDYGLMGSTLQWAEPMMITPGGQDRPRDIAARVRAFLAAAPDEVYAEVTAALDVLRGDGQHDSALALRVATSFLIPTRADWVTDDCRAVAAADAEDFATTLLYAISVTDQYMIIWNVLSEVFGAYTTQSMVTIVDAMGPASAVIVAHWIETSRRPDLRRRAVSTFAALPGDWQFQFLLDRAADPLVPPAILEAARRFPRRAMRLLATDGGHADTVGALVARHPELAAEVAATLPAEAAARLTGSGPVVVAHTEAPAATLPPVLADPPWLRETAGKARRPVLFDGPAGDEPPTVEWLPGERDEWLASMGTTGWGWQSNSWEEAADRIRRGDSHAHNEKDFFRSAPEELARPLIAAWRPPRRWAEQWTRAVAARFELDALPALLDVVRRTPATAAPALLPFASPEIAVLMADWYGRLRSVRATAEAWLVRHAASAARTLVPLAFSKPGPARRQAERALRGLVGKGRGDAVRTAAASYGPGVAEAVDLLLATDPVELYPARVPAVPAWVDLAALPRVHVDTGALPTTAARHIVTMLAMSRIDDPYAGLDQVRAVCARADRAEFVWSLFQSWRASGSPSKDAWTLDALGLFGDDETVRRLTPVIRAWAAESAMSRATLGLDALVAIGTDVALLHLDGIARKAKSKTLRDRATARVEEVATGQGLTGEQLADRLVPDLGLDPNGHLGLDYGRRRFTVGFDELLRPVILDGAGKRLRDLPKPGAADDPTLAPEAYKRFAALKKDVRTVAADQIRRLESAMVGRRRWSVAEFRDVFVAHPLLVHLARRLVWLVHDDDAATVSFRVAEDRTFADTNDEPRDLPAAATVSVAHPLHLGKDLATWSGVFSDYELLQPFPQLGREVYEDVVTFAGRTVESVRLLGLERRGWTRGSAGDGGRQTHLSRDMPDGTTATLTIDPGILAGMVGAEPVQTVTAFDLRPSGDDVDPVALSEVIRDLEAVTGA